MTELKTLNGLDQEEQRSLNRLNQITLEERNSIIRDIEQGDFMLFGNNLITPTTMAIPYRRRKS